jgi:hypothetical protein
MYKIIGGDRKEYGPVSPDEVRRWLAEGRLNGQSPVQAEGCGDWKPLTAYAEFAESLGQHATAQTATGSASPPVSPTVWSADILARDTDLQVGSCLSRSWELLLNDFVLLAVASGIVWLITLAQFIPVADLVYKILWGALYGGFYVLFLKRIRGQPGAVRDVFGGFKSSFGQLVLAGFLSSLLAGIGFLFCILPGIYLAVAWVFSVPLVSDKGMEFWPAMELSRKVVSRVWFKVLGLIVIAFVPMILVSLYAILKTMGLVLPLIREIITSWPPDLAHVKESVWPIQTRVIELGWLTRMVLLINLPFAVGALMLAYEDLFGARKTPTA